MTVKTVKCHKCKNEIKITGEPGEKIHILCHKCSSKGTFTFPKEKPESKTTTDSFTIEVSNLTKKYNNFKAVDDVSFNVKSGEIFGFLGPNGAGKTTTIKSILGLIHANSGEIKINDLEMKKRSKEAKKYIGYLPEKVAFYDNLTALQNLNFYAEMKNIPKEECKPLIEEMGIGDAVNKKVGKFSKGMQQRLGMARALIGNPPILILDEPSGGLDPRGVALIRNKIRQMKDKGSTVFVSSHILAEVQEVCDRVGIIDKGVIVAEDSVSKLSFKLNLKPKLIIELEKISEKIVKSVKEVEGVEKVESFGVMIHITCNQKAKSKIIISVEKAGGNIVNIQIKEPSLEEVFMNFTEG